MLPVSRDLHGTCWLSWVDSTSKKGDNFCEWSTKYGLTFDFSISYRFLLMWPAASLPNRSNLWIGASKLDEAMIFGEKGGGADGVHLDGKFQGRDTIDGLIWLLHWCYRSFPRKWAHAWELRKKQVGRLQMFQLGYQVQFPISWKRTNLVHVRNIEPTWRNIFNSFAIQKRVMPGWKWVATRCLIVPERLQNATL